MPTELSKPVIRRVQVGDRDLVVKIDSDGFAVRGFGKKTWHHATWARALSLFQAKGEAATPVIASIEEIQGNAVLAMIAPEVKTEEPAKDEESN